MVSSQVGVLLLNTGTPDAPTVSSVRAYLREFLSDPRVIDIPAWARFLLLYGVILPFRPRSSAKAYKQIWTAEGSPLLVYSLKFAKLLQEDLGPGFKVSMGMRYGNPSIVDALRSMETCSSLIVFPLFPQYASSSWGSAVGKVMGELGTRWNIPPIRVIPPFYKAIPYLESMEENVREGLKRQEFDHIVFSFHGLPVRHLKKSGCSETLLGKFRNRRFLTVGDSAAREPSLPQKENCHSYCYRAQCYEFVKLMAERLGLQNNYSVAFQSKLGRTEWIRPYLDDVLQQLAEQNVKRLAVLCPAFVADCLETLEEIGIRGKATWTRLGGESLTLLPCLNDDAVWVRAAGQIVRGAVN